jgi:catechol 2,3-dioxygenase
VAENHPGHAAEQSRLTSARSLRGSGRQQRPWQGLHPATKVGHVHLHVAALAPTHQFYHETLGFGIPFDFSAAPAGFAGTAMFFSAGGYHHHIGTNTWQGEGAPPPPPDATGLRYFTVIFPDQAELERVRAWVANARIALEPTENGWLAHDPAQNGVLLTADAAQ